MYSKTCSLRTPVLILEIGKHGPNGPLIFRNRGPLAHLGARPPNNNELSNAEPKYEEIGQYWSKTDDIVHE